MFLTATHRVKNENGAAASPRRKKSRYLSKAVTLFIAEKKSSYLNKAVTLLIAEKKIEFFRVLTWPKENLDTVGRRD